MTDGLIVRVLVYLLGASWRSTLAGLSAGVFIVWPELEAAFDGNPDTHVVWSKVIAAVMLAVWGRVGRDNKTTSEQAGAKGSA